MTQEDRIAQPTIREVPPLAGFDATRLLTLPAIIVVGWLTVLPLGFLVPRSFASTGSPATWTLSNYVAAFNGGASWSVLFNSVAFAGGSAAVALVLGTFFAWLSERTDTPFKALFYASSFVPLVIP